MNSYRCNNCGNEYLLNKPYLHTVLGVVCESCFIGNENLVDSELA